MTDLEAFLPYVEPHALGAPIPGLLHEIRSTLIDFCERTRCWQEVIRVGVRADRQEYDLPDPNEGDGEVFLIDQIILSDTTLEPVIDLDSSLSGSTAQFTELLPTSFLLHPVPSQAGSAYVRVAIKPTRCAGCVPDFIFSRYADTVSHGAIARLLETRNNPYGDISTAPYHRAMYENGLHSHAVVVSKRFISAPLRVAPDF